MIVADASVWVDYLRGNDTPQVLLLETLLGTRLILVPDLVLCEVLMGVRSERQAREVAVLLGAFTPAHVGGAALAVSAAGHYRRLRSLGVTLRKTIDLLIGSFCIAAGHDLLHSDRDYDVMEQHLGLSVVR